MSKKRKTAERSEENEENSKKLKKESVEIPVKEKPAPQRKKNMRPNVLYSTSDSSDSESDDNVKPSQNQINYTDSSSSDSSSSSSDSEKNAMSDRDKDSKTEVVPTKSVVPEPKAGCSSMQNSSSESYHSDTEEEDKKRRKKQKQQLQMLLNKKAKKGILIKRPPEPKQVLLDEGQSDDDIQDNIPCNSDVNDLPEWPQSDYAELIKRMEAQLPPKDNQKFDSRASKLDWEKIAFSRYSANDCLEVWSGICKRIRRFRILSEILQDAKEWVRQPWTNFYRGPKKNRHPDMPARPLSTYMIYYLEHKDKVSKKNPGLDMTQVSKLISEKYNTLSAAERNRYTELAAKERKLFESKLSDFYKEHPELIQPPKKSSAKESNIKGPRKPYNPFKLYLDHLLKKKENVEKRLVEEEAKEKWKSLSEKKKAVYINASLKDIERFEREVEEYRSENPDYSPPPIKYVLTKEEKLIKEKLAGKPLKPPNSAYSLFSRKMLQSDPGVKSLPPKERMSEISKKWKQLSDNQKLKFEEEVRKLQEVYKLEFATYLEGLTAEEREKELNSPKKNASKKKERATPSSKKNKFGEKKEETQKTDANLEKGGEVAGSSKKKTVTFLEESLVKRRDEEPEEELELYPGEPRPPPVTPFDIFLQSFHANKNHTERGRIREAHRLWERMGADKQTAYTNELEEMKKKYVTDFETFLKSLSPEKLVEFSRFKDNCKKKKRSLNGDTNFDHQDSDEDSCSSDSDSSASTAVSNKSSSTSDDSDS